VDVVEVERIAKETAHTMVTYAVMSSVDLYMSNWGLGAANQRPPVSVGI
jgi:hypothetical protein